MAYPTAESIEGLRVLSSSDVASLFGVKRQTLAMRIRRGHPQTPPPPDATLDGCTIWFLTSELVAALKDAGADVDRL